MQASHLKKSYCMMLRGSEPSTDQPSNPLQYQLTRMSSSLKPVAKPLHRQLTRMSSSLKPVAKPLARSVTMSLAVSSKASKASVAAIAGVTGKVRGFMRGGVTAAESRGLKLARVGIEPRRLSREETIKSRGALMHRLHQGHNTALGRAAAKAAGTTWTKEWQRNMHDEPAAGEVRKTLAMAHAITKGERRVTISKRKMRRYNSLLKLRLVVHATDAAGRVCERSLLLDVEDSIYLNKLVKAVQTTLGWAGKPRVMWLDADGETHELASQEAFARFVDHEWCSLPWVLHVCEGAAASLQSLTLHDRAKGMRTTAVDAPGSYRPRSYC